MHSSCFAWICLLGSGAGLLSATPVLRLSQTVVEASATQSQPATLVASNGGDGTLTVGVSVPAAVAWLTASTGTCAAAPGCTSIQLNFNPANLANGSYASSVTVYAPGALDSPQTVVVILNVMNGITTANPPISAYLTAGASCGIQFGPYGPTCPTPEGGIPITTEDGGTWLALSVNNLGTLQCFGNVAILTPPANMAPGNYSGSIALGGAVTQAVNMQVVPSRLAAPMPGQISVTLAEGGAPVAYPFVPAISLSADGTIAAISATSSGVGISAAVVGGQVHVSVDPSGLTPGSYNGTVTIGCQAADCPVVIPVSETIIGPGPPLITALVDNVTFMKGFLAPGEVVAIQGDQFTASPPVYADGPPLPTELGGVTVLVNGVAAPLYYVSSNQIAFELTSSLQAPAGAGVQVANGAQTSNTAGMTVMPSVPRIAAVTDAAYNLVDAFHPVHAGDTIILWAFGLGATNPPVPDGAAAPFSPLAKSDTALVQFGSGTPLLAAFAGLSPGAVGLYQVNATVPPGTPSGPLFVKLVYFSGVVSNAVPITIE